MVKARPNTTCDFCHSPCYIFPKRLRNNKNKFCSRKCFYSFTHFKNPERFRTCIECRKGFCTNIAYIRRSDSSGKFCSVKCTRLYKSKNRARNIASNGYINIWCEERKRMYPEHRIIMERLLGRRLLKSEHVHHINHIRTDNRIENLQVMSHSDHMKLHGNYSHLKKSIDVTCSVCGGISNKQAYYVRVKWNSDLQRFLKNYKCKKCFDKNRI